MRRFTLLFAAILVAAGLSTANAAIIFDDFNVNEGRFGLDPNFSGTSVNDDASSTADRVTTNGPLEGAGHQQLVLNHIDNADAGTNIVIRHLSGGGAAAGGSGQPANTAFTTGAGVDGWIGFFLKTTTPGWNAQLYLEGASNNGGVPKNIIADGQWHAYEWNLDDTTGGPDGWGNIAGVIAGSPTVANGSHTIDSIMLRNTTTSGTFFLDFVAKSDSGSIANLLNTAPTVTDAVVNNYNANEPGEPQTLTHQFLATDTETPAGPFTWDQLSLISYTPNYGGAGAGPAVAATLSGSGGFSWVSEGSPRGDYVWGVRGTDPGGLSDNGTITVRVTEVPEPTSIALCGLALAGICAAYRRK